MWGMSEDPYNINNCRDVDSIRAKLAMLDRMRSYNFDAGQKIQDTIDELERRLLDLGEGQD